MCRCAGSIFIDAALVNLDDYAVGNLHLNDARCKVDFLYGAINTTAGEHLCAFLQGVLEVLDFFAALVLRTNHKEIEDDEHQQNHYQWIAENHAQRIGLWCCLGSKE